MDDNAKNYSMYNDLSWAWPILSPKEDYARSSNLFAGYFKEFCDGAPNTLLHMGCGGGHNDYTFKRHFKVTGMDINENMLALARELNPEVEYLIGNMKNADNNEFYYG